MEEEIQSIGEQKKLFRVIKTVCQMMFDRGYLSAQKQILEQETQDFESFCTAELSDANQKIYIIQSNEMIKPYFFKNSNNEQAIVIFQKKVILFLINYNIKGLPIEFKKQIEHHVNNGFKKLIIIVHGDTDKFDKYYQRQKQSKEDHMPFIEELVSNQTIEHFNFEDLIYNITKHVLVPQHIPLTIDEKLELLKKYSINVNQLPKILITDPVSKYFGMPRGNVFKIIRDSETAGKYITYRVVV